MIQTLHEPVSVSLTYNHKSHEVKPVALHWSGRNYPVLKVGLRHTYKEGLTRHHVFSVVAHTSNVGPLAKLDRAKWGSSLFFRLNLNTDNLSWTLEEVSDGLPD